MLVQTQPLNLPPRRGGPIPVTPSPYKQPLIVGDVIPPPTAQVPTMSQPPAQPTAETSPSPVPVAGNPASLQKKGLPLTQTVQQRAINMSPEARREALKRKMGVING